MCILSSVFCSFSPHFPHVISQVTPWKPGTFDSFLWEMDISDADMRWVWVHSRTALRPRNIITARRVTLASCTPTWDPKVTETRQEATPTPGHGILPGLGRRRGKVRVVRGHRSPIQRNATILYKQHQKGREKLGSKT